MNNEAQKHFIKFPKMGQSYWDGDVKQKKKLVSKPMWIACEKIDGSNYSIMIFPDDSITPCKRNGPIDVKNDLYYPGHLDIIDKYRDSFILVAKELRKTGQEIVQIYGELYGGLWEGQNNGMIQDRAEYCPHIDYIVFSIINGGNELSYDDTIKICKKYGLPHVPIRNRGRIGKLLDSDPAFLSDIPKLHGLPTKDNAEGIVISTNEPIMNKQLGYMRRIYIKHKDERYSDRFDKTKHTSTSINNAHEYINENRYKDLISKHGTESIKKMSKQKQMELLVKDAMTDYIIDRQEQNPGWFIDKKTKIKLHKILLDKAKETIS